MNYNIDFKNPFNGRKWLQLLKTDPKFGLIFYPNLNLSSEYMGFSFYSNKFGLRGSDNIYSDLVICGTSYAMGLSVNNGDNWYELHPSYRDSFNIGMPIGLQNQLALLNSFYKGSKKHLLFIYHPNLWITSWQFQDAAKQNKNIFETMKWKTDYWSTLKLFFYWQYSKLKKKLYNRQLTYFLNDQIYEFNPHYAYFSFSENQIFFEEQITLLKQLFLYFERVSIIRIPIKEELALQYIYSSELKQLNESYDENWKYFKKHIPKNGTIYDLTDHFQLNDYLPNDTHWSKQGNQTFVRLLKKYVI